MVSTTASPIADQARAAVEPVLAAAREEQTAWAARGLHDRLAVIRHWRHRLVEHADELADAVTQAVPARRHVAETIAAEILPLADAMRFLERRAPALLLPRALGRRGLPAWLTGLQTQIQRAPWGVVLVIGPANYPLLLTMGPVLSAVVAGNAAVIKPAPGMAGVLRRMVELGIDAGVAPELIPLLGEDKTAAEAAIDAGVDHVVLTGSAATGRAVLRRCSETITPTTMELSGCDLLVVREDADLDLAAQAVTFGLRLNGSQTCMAPRRVMVHRAVLRPFQDCLLHLASELHAVTGSDPVCEQVAHLVHEAEQAGAIRLCGGIDGREVRPIVLGDARPTMAITRADVFAPVVALLAVRDDDEVLTADARCPYGLTAAIFGSPAPARDLADRLNVGVVQINDVIAPTADPRAPFGGVRHSGFGVTRGAEGLLAMTRPKVIAARRGRFRPHYAEMGDHDAAMLRAYLHAAHGRRLGERLHGWRRVLVAGRAWWRAHG